MTLNKLFDYCLQNNLHNEFDDAIEVASEILNENGESFEDVNWDNENEFALDIITNELYDHIGGIL